VTGPAAGAGSEGVGGPVLVDLSQEIYQGMRVFPGHLKTVIWQSDSHDETRSRFEGGFSYQANGLLLSEHGPTHVDSLSHLDPRPEAPSIENMPLGLFYGPATCLDFTHAEPRSFSGPAELDAAVERTGIEVRPGDILLFHTATAERHQGTPEYISRYPGLNEEGAEWLFDRGLKAFGVDAPSLDSPASRSYPVHMMCRARGMTHWENLANLGQVVGRRFTFIGFPLRIRAGTGSPVRAVAMLDD
jgi:kynurenine formamidase